MRPAARLLVLITLWMLAGLVASIWRVTTPVWLGFGMLLLLTSLVDVLTLLGWRHLRVRREVPARFALGVESEITLTVVNEGRFPCQVRIQDGVPAASQALALPWRGTVGGKGYVAFRYPVRLLQRGKLQFSAAHVERTSMLGLWRHVSLIGPEQSVRVYPNYEPVIRYSILAVAHQENQMGIVHRNRQGLSREFHQLRDYQEGDVLSQIDWNATSRRLSLISREYREQRDQVVILMVDSGRRMRAMDEGLPQFDHCLNAVLFLSFMALRQGDQVGVLSFGGTNRWLPPVKGQPAMTTVLNHLYDYQTTSRSSDFSEATERLMARQKRRALVVVLTNLRSEDAGDVIPSLRMMQRNHLVMLASLREHAVQHTVKRPIESFDDALLYGATHLYLKERGELFEELRAHGIITLDDTAMNLPVALVNAYLGIKQSGRL